VTSRSWLTKGADKTLAEACVRPSAVLADVNPNPTFSDLVNLAGRMPSVSHVVALGGGSVIDAAKGVLAMNELANDREAMLKHLRDGAPLPPEINPRPLIAIPTTSGSGSEVTQWGTIWSNDGIKYSVTDAKLYPRHAILDPSLCVSMPSDLTLATALDALSHAMESVWNVRHTPITDGLAAQAIQLVWGNLETAMSAPENLPARRSLQTAAVLAGLAISKTQTALAHSISYPFTAQFNIPHGLACSFTLPEIARFNGEHDPARLEPIARSLSCTTGDVAEVLEKWLISLGVGKLLLSYVQPSMIDGIGDGLITRARAKNNIRSADGATARGLAHRALIRLNPDQQFN